MRRALWLVALLGVFWTGADSAESTDAGFEVAAGWEWSRTASVAVAGRLYGGEDCWEAAWVPLSPDWASWGQPQSGFSAGLESDWVPLRQPQPVVFTLCFASSDSVLLAELESLSLCSRAGSVTDWPVPDIGDDASVSVRAVCAMLDSIREPSQRM
jgi:hypothetical protein